MVGAGVVKMQLGGVQATRVSSPVSPNTLRMYLGQFILIEIIKSLCCLYRNSGSHGTASELMSIWSWGAKGRPSVLDRVKILANQDYIHHFKTLNMCSHCKWCRSSRGQSNPSRLDNQSKKKHKKILIPDKMKKKETWESLQLTRMLTGSGGGSVVSSSA